MKSIGYCLLGALSVVCVLYVIAYVIVPAAIGEPVDRRYSILTALFALFYLTGQAAADFRRAGAKS